MADILATALAELEQNLGQQMQQQSGKGVMQDIQEQTRIVVDIVKFDIEMLSDDKQNTQEKNKQLSPLYKSALRNHYLTIITTLNAALKETEVDKQKVHTEKLKKLADISKPALKSALYALASLCFYMTSVLAASKVSALVALTPLTGGASLVAAVPVTIAAGKMKQKGDDFFSESEKYYQKTMAIKNLQEKVKLIKRSQK